MNSRVINLHRIASITSLLLKLHFLFFSSVHTHNVVPGFSVIGENKLTIIVIVIPLPLSYVKI